MASLLKQLVIALGIFIRHHLSRVFGRRNARPPGAHQESQESVVGKTPGVDLDPVYKQLVAWQTDHGDMAASGTTSNPIYQLWRETPQGHKWTHYFETYQAIFGSRRHTSMRVLEIGVLHGASLRLWKNYFQHVDTQVVGIDIDPTCAVHDAPTTGIHVRIGSQADGEFLARVVDEFGPFDLIIDDGSHHSTHMIKSFNCLYATGLKDDGIYFVEDLHANYWLPWRDSPDSFLDLCKDLLEFMHAHYWKNQLPVWLEQAQSGSVLTVEVPEITKLIREIRFFDSMVAIYKTRRPHVPRYIVA